MSGQDRMKQNRVESRCTLQNEIISQGARMKECSDQTDPERGTRQLAEVITDGTIQYGYRCG